MLYPAKWKRITVDQSKFLKNWLFRFFWGATRYRKEGADTNIFICSKEELMQYKYEWATW